MSSEAEVKLVELTREECFFQLDYSYISNGYYDVTVWREKDSWKAELVKKPFAEPLKKTFKGTFFEPQVEEPRVFAAQVEGQNVGWIELGYQKWNNTMRVWEFLVKEEYRGRGVGTALMDMAARIAREKEARMLVLETQSCNVPAITFYLKFGFDLIGFDTAAYSNNDIDKKEVRLEMGLKLQ